MNPYWTLSCSIRDNTTFHDFRECSKCNHVRVEIQKFLLKACQYNIRCEARIDVMNVCACSATSTILPGKNLALLSFRHLK